MILRGEGKSIFWANIVSDEISSQYRRGWRSKRMIMQEKLKSIFSANIDSDE
jgi:hypothetical protein